MAVNPVQLQKFLGGMSYPATKDQVVQHAEQNGADENVLSTLRDLPFDEFNSPNDISEAVGKST